MKQCKLILLLLCSILAEAQTQLPDGFITQQIAAGLDPTAIALAPDGRIFIAIKSGQIAIVENGELLQHPFLTIDVDNSNERGLSGIAFDPDFEFNNYIYVFYTVPAQNRNRVSRFTANGNFAVPGSETILLDLDVMPGNIHNAGAMQFGKDGKLYIATGDGAQASNAQSMQNLLGKILRINKDGSIPEDNPFYASTQDNNRAIYAIGFRNPFTMDIHPHSGDIIIGDVGEGTWEEINLVHAGGNYGWPQIEGKRTTQTPPANYQDPIYAYNHSEGCAITGVAFYHPQMLNFPLQFQDKILFADYCSGFIKTFDQENNVTENFASGINRPIAIRTAPDGSVYYLARAGMGGGSPQDNTSSTNGSLWQIKYTGSGEPFITSQPQDVRAVIGESVNFTVNALGLQPLQYQWQRDETDIEGANNPTFQIESVSLTDHQKSFRCIISNELGEVISDAAQLEVIDNTRPEPEILLPAQDALYRAGEMLYFEGSATDAEDGDLPASALSWRINFHHDDHYHPAMPDLAGTFSGTYEIPRIGELSDNVWYRVFLTATDADGFSKTVFRDVHPVKTNITVNSEPSGVLINVDGQLMQTPASISSVVGITRTFEALAGFEIDNKLYVFDSWSNGSTTRLLQYNAAEENPDFTARYIELNVGEGSGLVGFYFSNQDRTFNAPATLTRVDEVINFNWGLDSPAEEISNNFFTIRWRGEVSALVDGYHTFHVTADDGIRLWIDDFLIIDQWVAQAATEATGVFNMKAGNKYLIRLDYFEEAGNASVKLEWSHEKINRQVIPKSQLHPDIILSVKNDIKSPGLDLFPSISKEKINIRLSENVAENHTWRIYNQLGQEVLTGNLDQPELQIEINQLRPGVYFFRTGNITRKFFKQQ